MKNIEERVLKYLSGLMSDSERTKFESDLKNSDKLKRLVNDYSDKLFALKDLKNVDIDERYFNNLLPKTREQFNENKATPFVAKHIALIPAIALSVFIVFHLVGVNIKNPETLETVLTEFVAGADSSELDDLFVQYSDDLLDADIVEPNITDDYFSDVELSNQLTAGIIESYDLYERITDEDADYIYEYLIDKKIF